MRFHLASTPINILSNMLSAFITNMWMLYKVKPSFPLAFAFAVLSVGCPCCEDDKRISKQASNDYSFILRVTNVNDLITSLGLGLKNETFVTVTYTNNFGNK